MSGLLAAVFLTTLLAPAYCTRCYMCRDVTYKSGNRRVFNERRSSLQDMGWVASCSDDTFVVYPQVSCVERTFISHDMCSRKKKCTVKVTERYPTLPSVMTEGVPFFSTPLNEANVKTEKTCRGDLCNGNYRNKYETGLKCYHQCGEISLYGLTAAELATYNLPVIPCDRTTYNYCGNDMECGYIVGRATYTDVHLGKDITVVGWYADCFNQHNDDISHVLETVSVMMSDHPSLQITENDLTKCDRDLCNVYN